MENLIPKIKNSMLAFEKTLEEGGDINTYISLVIKHALENGTIKSKDVMTCVCNIISFFDEDPDCNIWEEIDDSTTKLIVNIYNNFHINIKTNKACIKNNEVTLWPNITIYGDTLTELILPNAKGNGSIVTNLGTLGKTNLQKIDLRSWDCKEYFPLDTHILNTVSSLMDDYPALKEFVVSDPVSVKQQFKHQRKRDINNFASAQNSVKAKKLLNKELAFLDKVLKKG